MVNFITIILLKKIWKLHQELGGFPISTIENKDFSRCSSVSEVDELNENNMAVVVQRLERTVVVRKTGVRFTPSALLSAARMSASLLRNTAARERQSCTITIGGVK